jgi:hypothetical protein
LIISKVNFQGKGGKHSQKDTKNEKKREGFEKKLLLIISKDNFQGKGRKNNPSNTERKQNEKKRKGFEKKLWWQCPRTRDHFRSKGKKNDNAKGGKNKNEQTMKKLNRDKKGMIIFNPKNDDQNKKMKK